MATTTIKTDPEPEVSLDSQINVNIKEEPETDVLLDDSLSGVVKQEPPAKRQRLGYHVGTIFNRRFGWYGIWTGEVTAYKQDKYSVVYRKQGEDDDEDEHSPEELEKYLKKNGSNVRYSTTSCNDAFYQGSVAQQLEKEYIVKRDTIMEQVELRRSQIDPHKCGERYDPTTATSDIDKKDNITTIKSHSRVDQLEAMDGTWVVYSHSSWGLQFSGNGDSIYHTTSITPVQVVFDAPLLHFTTAAASNGTTAALEILSKCSHPSQNLYLSAQFSFLGGNVMGTFLGSEEEEEEEEGEEEEEKEEKEEKEKEEKTLVETYDSPTLVLGDTNPFFHCLKYTFEPSTNELKFLPRGHETRYPIGRRRCDHSAHGNECGCDFSNSTAGQCCSQRLIVDWDLVPEKQDMSNLIADIKKHTVCDWWWGAGNHPTPEETQQVFGFLNDESIRPGDVVLQITRRNNPDDSEWNEFEPQQFHFLLARQIKKINEDLEEVVPMKQSK